LASIFRAFVLEVAVDAGVWIVKSAPSPALGRGVPFMFDIFVKSLFGAGRYLRRDHSFFPAPASVALLATAARFTSRIAFAFAIAASISGFAGGFTF